MARKFSSQDMNSIRIPEDTTRQTDDLSSIARRKSLPGVPGLPGVPDLADTIDDPTDNLKDTVVQSMRKFLKKR